MTETWFHAFTEVEPYIFKIATPDGYGTGFQVLYPERGSSLCGIATAYHVVDHADEWEEAIKITHHTSGKTATLKDSDRAIIPYPKYDLAFILFGKSVLPLKANEPKLISPKHTLKPGVELSWCGFPSIAPPRALSFFSGHVSSCLSEDGYYLVDGVAINGVSGGPAFYISRDSREVKIAGVISAYRPNRVYGETHPGLSKVCSVEPYQEMLKDFRSKAEAQAKAEEEKKKIEKEDPSTVTQTDTPPPPVAMPEVPATPDLGKPSKRKKKTRGTA